MLCMGSTHMSMWALMVMLLLSYLYFGYWWHSGMKRSGQTLHVLAHETCSTLDMQLVLHKRLAGVYLSYYSQYLICNELSTIWLSLLWFMFVGKNGSISKALSHVKFAMDKLEASSLDCCWVSVMTW